MGKPVKVSDDVMEAVRAAAALQSRSIAGQVEHWIQLGRAFERQESHDAVERALKRLISPDTLTAEQQEQYFDRLEQVQWGAPSEAEESFFADRRARGLGVGMTDDGHIVTGAEAAKPR